MATMQGEDNKCLLVGKLMMLKMNSLQSSAEEWFDEEKFLSLIIYSRIRFRKKNGEEGTKTERTSRRKSMYCLRIYEFFQHKNSI